MRPRVAGTAMPKITMIGPTSASAPIEATWRSENATMPAVARRASTPRRARARTWAAVPAAPPNGAAVATALPTSWVDAMRASEGARPSRRRSRGAAAPTSGTAPPPGRPGARPASTSRSRPVDPTRATPRAPTAPGGTPRRRRGSTAARGGPGGPRGPIHRPDGRRLARGISSLIDDERGQEILVRRISHSGFHGTGCELEPRPRGRGREHAIHWFRPSDRHP